MQSTPSAPTYNYRLYEDSVAPPKRSQELSCFQLLDRMRVDADRPNSRRWGRARTHKDYEHIHGWPSALPSCVASATAPSSVPRDGASDGAFCCAGRDDYSRSSNAFLLRADTRDARWMTAYRTGAWRLQIMATSGGPRLTHLCLNSAVSSNAIGKTAEFGIGVRSRFAALRVSLSRARTHALTVGFPGTKSCEGLEGSRA